MKFRKTPNTAKTQPLSRLPHLRIEKNTRDGRGSFTFIMSRKMFDNIFPSAELAAADDQSEFYDDKLRGLCAQYSNERSREELESQEEERPGSTELVVNTPEGLVLNSRELGHEVVKRFAQEPDPDEDDLLKPAYSEVEVTLRVFDMPETGHSHTDAQSLSHLVHHTVLHPPQLA